MSAHAADAYRRKYEEAAAEAALAKVERLELERALADLANATRRAEFALERDAQLFTALRRADYLLERPRPYEPMPIPCTVTIGATTRSRRATYTAGVSVLAVLAHLARAGATWTEDHEIAAMIAPEAHP